MLSKKLFLPIQGILYSVLLLSSLNISAVITPESNLTDVVKELLAASDIDTIKGVIQYYPEMAQLAGNVQATPEGLRSEALEGSPSKQLYGTQHIEFDRTAVGILALKWVLNGNYAQFTSPQNAAVKLTQKSFDDLRNWTKNILKTPEDIDAMITYMVINDLGKINAVIDEIERKTGMSDVDHDKVLLVALEKHPEISPSFQRLAKHYQEMIIKGLAAKFNIGQFIQGENVPASLLGLKGLDQASLDFYLLHAVYDIAGAAGHVNPKGSVIMSEPTYQGFYLSIASIEKLVQGADAEQVYNDYLETRGKILGIDIKDAFGKAAERINLLVRSANAAQAKEVEEVLHSLPKNVLAILEKELSISGVNDGWAILLYYSPAVLANTIAKLTKDGVADARKKGLEIGLTTLARLFQEARALIKKRTGNGVYTLMVSEIAKQAAADPTAMADMNIKIVAKGEDGEASFESNPTVNPRQFPQIQSLNEIPGKRIAVIGIGGGSDGIQAAMLASILPADKEVVAVLSIRTSAPGSAIASGQTSASRTITNHGGEVVPGVFRVTQTSTGTGRFFENLPAEKFKSYLVIDEENNTLAARIQAALHDAGGADTVIGVDTGGDALYPMPSIAEGEKLSAHATPDQDLRVLQALKNLTDKYHIMIAEIAVGIDSPANAQEILQNAHARYYQLTPEQVTSVLDQYKKWGMDGSNEARYGKTALTWQAALSGKLGLHVMPLPTKIVVDPKNPWIPFVIIDSAMAGIFFMELQNHLHAIGGE